MSLEQYSTTELLDELFRRDPTLFSQVHVCLLQRATTTMLMREIRRRQAEEQHPAERSAQASRAAKARWKKRKKKRGR